MPKWPIDTTGDGWKNYSTFVDFVEYHNDCIGPVSIDETGQRFTCEDCNEWFDIHDEGWAVAMQMRAIIDKAATIALSPGPVLAVNDDGLVS